MPTFELEANGKRFQVEAPDIQSAVRALTGTQTKPPAAASAPTAAADAFTPPDGSYADHWKGTPVNSPNTPNFDPQRPTAYRDQFGEWSVSDANDAPPGTASPDQLEALAANERSRRALQPMLEAKAAATRQTMGVPAPKGDFQGTPAQLAASGPQVSPLRAGMEGAADSATFGFGDEIGAGLDINPLQGDWGGQYIANLERRRADQQAAQGANPGAYLGGQVAGVVPTLFLPGGAVAKGVGIGAKVARGAVTGGAMGAAYGAGSANGDLTDRAIGAGEGAALGAVTGGSVPVAGQAIGAVVGKVGGKAAVPAIDELKSQATALYDTAKNAGVVIRPQSFSNLGKRIAGALIGDGFSADVQKQTAAALVPVQRDIAAGVSPSLTDIDNYRKVVLNVARLSTDPAERKMAGTALDELDNWLSNLSPADASAGDPKAGFAALNQARDLWRTQAKAQKIEDLIYDGTGNMRPSDEIRNGFNALRRNKNKLRGFTDDEKAAVAAVAHWGTGGRTKKVLAAFDPRNPVMAGLWTALGVSGGAPLAVAGGAAAFAAKQALASGTKKAANTASATVRNGGTAPVSPLKALGEGAANYALTPVARGSVPSLLHLLPDGSLAP